MKKLSFIIILLFIAQLGSSQTLHSLYFFQDNDQRDELNPAFSVDHNFVTFPGLGNIYVNANSNIGLKAFMQPSGNEMVTFLNPNISIDNALSNFKHMNIIEADANINIFKIGFHAMKGMNTIGINVKSQTGAYLPKGIFEFLKAGQTNEHTEYNMSNVNVVTQNYVELALGHSHKINKKLSLGGRLKVLFGGAYSKAHIQNMNISMSSNEWIINQTSNFIASKGVNFETNDNGKIDKIKFGNWGLAGMGLGLDLGMEYKINKNATFSFAITDLGFIKWNKCSTGYNKNQSFKYDGFTNIATEDSKSFNDAADEIWKNLKGLVEYHEEPLKKSKTTSLYTTIRGAGEYGIINNKISFGLLASLRVGAPKLWAEAMVSTNFRPTSWFSAAVNGSYSNVRSSIGTALNFHPKIVNFFIGMDYFLATYGKQFIPVNAAKVNIGFGLSFNY